VKPRLHVVYRSCGVENRKARPSYYSKDVALASFVCAVRTLDAQPEVIFLNDGDLPVQRLEVMRACGEVLAVRCGSNVSSYRQALRLALHRGWGDDDIVWFAEDDYLYQPDALQILVAGLRALPHGEYFSLYSPMDIADRRRDPGTTTAGRSMTPDAAVVDATRWLRAVSTTSTFAVRLAALRKDYRLLYACSATGGAWDHTTCLAVQGIQPFPWGHLLRGLLPPHRTALPRWGRSVARSAVRMLINLRSARRRPNRRILYAAYPLPIWHMEAVENDVPGLDLDQRWHDLAHQTLSGELNPIPAGGHGADNAETGIVDLRTVTAPSDPAQSRL